MKKNTSLLLMIACCTAVVPAYSQVAPDNTLYLSTDGCTTMQADTPAQTIFPVPITLCYKPAPAAVNAHICKVSAQLKLVGTAVNQPTNDQFTIEDHAPGVTVLGIVVPGTTELFGLNVVNGNAGDGAITDATPIISVPRVDGDNLGWEITVGTAGLPIASPAPIALSSLEILGTPAVAQSGLAIDLAGIQMVVTASPPAAGAGCDVITVSDASIPAVIAAPAGYRIGIRAFPAAVPSGTIAGLGVMLFAVAGIGAYLRRRRS